MSFYERCPQSSTAPTSEYASIELGVADEEEEEGAMDVDASTTDEGTPEVVRKVI